MALFLKFRRWALASDIDYGVKSYHGHDMLFRFGIAWHGKRIDRLANQPKSWWRTKQIMWHASRQVVLEQALVDLSIMFHREAVNSHEQMKLLEKEETQMICRKAAR